jgi:hypothetical protein
LQDSFATFKIESRPSWVAFLFRASISRAEVFNMFVENSVEKKQSTFVTDSASDASAFCTTAGAGTFRLRLADKILW